MSNCSERNASMRDYIGRGALVFAVILLAIAKNNNWLDGTTIVAIAFLAILGYMAFVPRRTTNSRQLLASKENAGDEPGEVGEDHATPDPLIINGWAILIYDCPVYVAKETAEKLTSAALRCRLEIAHEDRAFHRQGNFGMGTRMRVLVPPGEYESAMKIANLA